MFLGWTPTKFVKIGVISLFHGILGTGNFVQLLVNSKKFFFVKTTDQKSFMIFGLESPQRTLFLVYSVTYIYSFNKRSLFNPFLTISETDAHICCKFGVDVSLVDPYQICLNSGCYPYF